MRPRYTPAPETPEQELRERYRVRRERAAAVRLHIGEEEDEA